MVVDYRTARFSTFAQGALLGFMALTAASAWTTLRWAAAEIEDSGDAREHLLSFEKATQRAPEKGFSGWASLQWDFARPIEVAPKASAEASVIVAQAHPIVIRHAAPVKKKVRARVAIHPAAPQPHPEVLPRLTQPDDASELRIVFQAIRAQRQQALAALDAAAVADVVADLVLPGEIPQAEIVADAAPIFAKKVAVKARRAHPAPVPVKAIVP